MDPDILRQAVPLMLAGAKTTLLITALGVLFGLPLGLGLALLRNRSGHPLARAGDLYSGLFRGTPMLVQIFILYYGLAEIHAIRHNALAWWIVGDALHCAVLAVVMNTTAYTSELFRTAFRAIPGGYLEAADACGMSRAVRFRRITLPLALRHGLPAYASEVVIIVKETSLASTITVLEITGHAKRLMSQTFAVLEIFVIAAVFYLVINLACMAVLRLIERRFAAHERRPRTGG